MKEFLEDHVSPQWNTYLKGVSERERSIGLINKGAKFWWVEFFKDIQKFYRLIFRLRFHRWDKRKDKNRGPLVKVILSELGIHCKKYDFSEVFWFFYSVLNKLRKNGTSLKHGEEEEKEVRTFTKVFQDDS